MRTAFVSGASSDIGIALCRRYLEAGWAVIAHYRTPRGELAALEGVNLQTLHADFSDTAALEQAISSDLEVFSRADAFVNLAADLRPIRFESATAADMLEALATNTIPGLLLMRAIGPAMAERGFGRIVHASSIGTKFGGGGDSFTYSLSKHAQEFIPRACRQWAASNVFVNVARIGVTDTRFHDRLPGKDLAARARLIPAGRAASPEDAAETLFWLGSEHNRYVTGEIISAAGGE